MLSVAASSIDRRFVDRAVLGNGKTIVVGARTTETSSLITFEINPDYMALIYFSRRDHP